MAKSTTKLGELQLVNYNQANLLKELGFDWETDVFYEIKGECINDSEEYHHHWINKNSVPINDIFHQGTEFCSAPLIAQALKWFRDEIGYYPSIICNEYGIYSYKIGSTDELSTKYSTYELMESALLDELIMRTKSYIPSSKL